MDENLGRQHEDEVLQAFDRLGGEFLAAAEEAEEPAFSVQDEGGAAAAYEMQAASEPLVGRSARNKKSGRTHLNSFKFI